MPTTADVIAYAERKKKIKPLVSFLNKKNSAAIRQVAAKALGRIGDPQSVEPLINALGDDDPGVRQAVREALGKMDDPRAKDALAKMGVEEVVVETTEKNATQYANATETPVLDSIFMALKPHFESDEQLLETGSVHPPFNHLVFFLGGLFLTRPWFYGITQKRILFTPKGPSTGMATKPDRVIPVQLGDVALVRKGKSGAKLLIANNRAVNLPRKFTVAKVVDIDKLQAMLGGH